jgi:hypothetical protein
VAPNSALTRFIKQGLRLGVCPLCRAAYKLDGEYMWAFFDDYSQSDRTLDALRRARGFCAEHAGRLRRLEVEGLRSNLGISGVYLDTFKGLADQLDALNTAAQLPPEGVCPACEYRDAEVERNAGYLIEEIHDNGWSRKRLAEGDGLCFPHFAMVWARAEDGEERELLLDLQRRVVADVITGLEANIAKQGHEQAEGPSDRESMSWQRAIHLTAGWSKEALRDDPPDPEHRYQLPEYARVSRNGAGK